MTHYSYQDIKLSAKTDIGARRQVAQLIKDGKATDGDKIQFFRDSDHCRGSIAH